MLEPDSLSLSFTHIVPSKQIHIFVSVCHVREHTTHITANPSEHKKRETESTHKKHNTALKKATVRSKMTGLLYTALVDELTLSLFLSFRHTVPFKQIHEFVSVIRYHRVHWKQYDARP